jgi:tetratricopeptide (TPR) repeat protein
MMAVDRLSPAGGSAADISVILIDDGRPEALAAMLAGWTVPPAAGEILLVSAAPRPAGLKPGALHGSPAALLAVDAAAGFAERCNRGLEAATGALVLIVAEPLLARRDFVPSMARHFAGRPDLGALAPVFFAPEPPADPHAGARPPSAFGAHAADCAARFAFRQLPLERLRARCLMLRRSLAAAIGPLAACSDDPLQVLGEFCRRVELHRFATAQAGDCLVTGAGPMQSGRSAVVLWRPSAVLSSQGAAQPVGAGGEPPLPAAVLAEIKRADLARQRQDGAEKASRILIQAIGRFPRAAVLYHRLAALLIQYRRWRDAAEVLGELESGEDHPQAVLLRGQIALGEGNRAGAERAADRLVPLPVYRFDGLLLRARVALASGSSERAEALLREAIGTAPHRGEGWVELGAMRWREGNAAEGLERIARGFGLQADDPEIAAAFVQAVNAAGAHPRGIGLVRAALPFFPSNKRLRLCLIDWLLACGRSADAMAEIEAALAILGLDAELMRVGLEIRQAIGPLRLPAGGRRGSVSLCMIVRDEERHLARCLQSLKPVVDEMIVVDTGSQDRTRDIAALFGARLFQIAWPEDFSAARNHAMDRAEGDWILIMDGDEVLSARDHRAFRALIGAATERPLAYLVTTRNYQHQMNTIGWMPNTGEYPDEEQGSGWIATTKVRLVTSDPRLRFSYPVHEMLDPALLRERVRVGQCPFPVHHFGKLDAQNCRRKGAAYFQLGMKKLDALGDSEIALRELATEAGLSGFQEEAIALWRRFLALEPQNRFVLDAHINIASACGRLGRYDEAAAAAREALRREPEMKEAAYSLAYAELHRGNLEQVVEILEPLVERQPLFPPARFVLAAALFGRGQSAAGRAQLEILRGMPMGEALAVAFATLARELLNAGQVRPAARLLQAAVDNDHVDAEVLRLLSRCLKEKGDAMAGVRVPAPATQS